MSEIISIATGVPSTKVNQEQALANSIACSNGDAMQKKVLNRLYRSTQIESRASIVADETRRREFFIAPSSCEFGLSTGARMSMFDSHAGDLALRVCSDALRQAQLDPARITHLVTASCTGFRAPGVDLSLISSLPLPHTTSRTNIGFMGCHAALNAMRVANAIAASEPESFILVSTTELCSLHFQYAYNLDNVTANALFADGSAAFVICAANPEALCSYASGYSYIVPQTESLMTWSISDHGFVMSLSAQVPSIIESTLADALIPWLQSHNLSIADIGGWCIHPGGPKILDAVQAALDLSNQKMSFSRQVLAEYGNMSSPTVLFVLQRLLSANQERPYVVLAFGPGITIEAALLV